MKAVIDAVIFLYLLFVSLQSMNDFLTFILAELHPCSYGLAT